jgi:hypothetical protein
LAFGVVPESRQESVVDFINRGMACSVYGSVPHGSAFTTTEADYALSYASLRSRSWYNMIQLSSTVALEAWDMKYKPNAGGTTLGGQFQHYSEKYVGNCSAVPEQGQYEYQTTAQYGYMAE